MNIDQYVWSLNFNILYDWCMLNQNTLPHFHVNQYTSYHSTLKNSKDLGRWVFYAVCEPYHFGENTDLCQDPVRTVQVSTEPKPLQNVRIDMCVWCKTKSNTMPFYMFISP